tara:strand:+ start:266 stop:1270 length:1005 start_codon:yes stop_codon:yes gene_type:complete
MTTKTDKTKNEYILKAKQLMIRAYKEALEKTHQFSEDKNTVVLDYKDKSNIGLGIHYTAVWAVKNWAITLYHSSWKYYRSAIIYYAELEHEKGSLNIKQLDKIKELLRRTKGHNDKDIAKTSHSKKKSLNLKELKSIDNKLKDSKSRWAKPTRIFIRAGKYTGLRPIEWQRAEINIEKKLLRVFNAKSTNGRSLGETRTLSLKHLDDKQIKDIENHILLVKNIISKNAWDQYYNGCSSLLKRITRKLWPNKKKYPTLYSCRHQFSADMKASGCTKREVAALMGHANDLTAQEHYGRKLFGTRGRKPIVNSVDLQRVKETNKNNKFKLGNNKKDS